MSTQASTLSSEEQKIVNQVSADELMNSTRSIAQWVRMSGSPEEAEAFDWIQAQLEKYGLETNRYLHPALVSWPESASLTLTTAGGETIDIPCKTHAFGTSTPPGGIQADLVYVGRATKDNLEKADVKGKIALFDGIIAPNHNQLVESYGVAGSIWIAGSRLHERGLSPVWGTPTPETVGLLPTTPSVSVVAEQGDRIKEALKQGPVQARMVTEVYQDWGQLPLLTGDLRPAQSGPDSDEFVLFSGHVDSWYYGAMDNGTANATMLEVARILAQHRGDLRRGLRVAFWSGHSHARYAGSAWYADTFWQELHDHAVAHVNVDSVGGMGSSVLSEGNTMSETREFVSDAIEPIAGQRLVPRRFGRAGDQSFWGTGLPSMLMSLSEQPAENADPVLLALHQQISGGAGKSGGLGSWWHTPEDTVDKIDPQLLKRDAQIYTLLLYRLCTVKVLPFKYSSVVNDLKSAAESIRSKAGESFDMGPVLDQIGKLGTAVTELESRISALESSGKVNDQQASDINHCLMALGRDLIPVDYTNTGMFDHDLAVPTRPLPALQEAATLAQMDPNSSEYHYLQTKLVRARNRVVHGLGDATQAVERTLAELKS